MDSKKSNLGPMISKVSHWLARLGAFAGLMAMLAGCSWIDVYTRAAVHNVGERDVLVCRLWEQEICDGRGGVRPLGASKDYFALYLELLAHPDRDVRSAAGIAFAMNRYFPGHEYGHLADAYCEAGRADEMMAALYAAWRASGPGRCPKVNLTKGCLDARRRAFAWAHPELLGSPRSGALMLQGQVRVGFRHYNSEKIDAWLAAEGDRQHAAVLSYYQSYLADLRGAQVQE